jgi:NitT/TauT family transport system permease protein
MFKTWLGKHYKLTVAVLAWLIIWKIAAVVIDKEIFVAAPEVVLVTLAEMAFTAEFWQTVAASLSRIATGFFVAVCMGTVLAAVSSLSDWASEFISVLMKLIKSIPVASFVIILLLWINSANLSLYVSFLMVLPIIYFNIQKGIQSTGTKMIEMAEVFRFGFYRRFRYVYLPAVMPYFVSACSVGLGFCWKSGIAAELIGQPKGSVGEMLYRAKLYLMTKELFAWTVVIVLLAAVFEKLVMLAIKAASKKLLRG